MLKEAGFEQVWVSEPYDTFSEAGGEKSARAFGVFGYTFMARKPL